MIEVKELSKRYGPIAAVDNVSFHVERGEIVGFLGPNGAGKSTTMRILTGALGATSGTASIEGFDVAEKPYEAKRRLGYLPELPPVYPEMTVSDYLDYCARLHAVERSRRKSAVGKTMEMCGLSHVSNRLIGHLSKGYQQRVGLAQALVHEPPVIVLDEPTVGLDPNQISEVRKLIRDLAGKHTIILSTHILPEVQMTSQRVIIINRGRVVAQDSIENLMNQVQNGEMLNLKVRRDVADAVDVLTRLSGVKQAERAGTTDGETLFQIQATPGTDVREELARLAFQKDWGLLELSRSKMSLEEVFRQLTTVESSGTGERGGA